MNILTDADIETLLESNVVSALYSHLTNLPLPYYVRSDTKIRNKVTSPQNRVLEILATDGKVYPIVASLGYDNSGNYLSYMVPSRIVKRKSKTHPEGIQLVSKSIREQLENPNKELKAELQSLHDDNYVDYLRDTMLNLTKYCNQIKAVSMFIKMSQDEKFEYIAENFKMNEQYRSAILSDLKKNKDVIGLFGYSLSLPDGRGYQDVMGVRLNWANMACGSFYGNSGD
jgi:hypothetical protein